METRWTKGPWASEQCCRQDGEPLPEWIVSSEMVLDDFGDELAIATVYWKEANARLIAAAPELFAALAGCQKALALLLDAEAVKAGVSNMTVWAQCTEAEVKARAALRAARGEQGDG